MILVISILGWTLICCLWHTLFIMRLGTNVKSSVMPKLECTATAAKPPSSVPNSTVFQGQAEAREEEVTGIDLQCRKQACQKAYLKGKQLLPLGSNRLVFHTNLAFTSLSLIVYCKSWKWTWFLFIYLFLHIEYSVSLLLIKFEEVGGMCFSIVLPLCCSSTRDVVFIPRSLWATWLGLSTAEASSAPCPQ